jgi:nicotinate-nucleotide pyrophosphorylase (carboxylating)
MNNIDQLISIALEEDIGAGDITSIATIPEAMCARGAIRAKEALTLAGMDVARRVFAAIDPAISWDAKHADGDRCPSGELLVLVEGKARALLAGERTALNFLQRLSGVATLARRFATLIEGTKAKILDTRKTTPGWRLLEKAAVKAGGCENHRVGLYEHFLIKNNHVAVAGSIRTAVKRAHATRKPNQKIEIEARTLAEVRDAAAAGVDISMLDNMTVPLVREALGIVAGRAKIEVSGNITLDNVRAYAETGVDFISVGALTHSAPAADIHMLIEIVED